jgi:hypothetical protein
VSGAALGLAAFDALVLATGYSLLWGIGLVRSPRSVLAALGLAFFVGWGAVGAVLAFALMAGIEPAVVTVVLAAALLCVVGRLLLPRFFATRELPRVPLDRRPGALVVAGVGAALVGLAGLAALAVAARSGADSSWDVWAVWLPKAKAVYYFHGLDTGLGGATTFPRTDHPPLVPALAAAEFHFIGGVKARYLPLQQCLLSLAFLGSIVALLRQRVPGWILFPLLALLALSPEFWNRMWSVLPDQELGYFAAAAGVVCVLWLTQPRGAWLALGAIFLVTATLTKTEGSVIAGLLALVVIAAATRLPHVGASRGLVLLAGPAAIIPWKLWLADHRLPLSTPEYSWHDLLEPSTLGSRIGRLGYALPQMLDSAFSTVAWLLVLPLALVALALAARAAVPVAAAVAAWLVLDFASLAAVYWIGKPEIHWYVNTSVERVIATLPLVAGTLTPLLLALALTRKPDEFVPGQELPQEASISQAALL